MAFTYSLRVRMPNISVQEVTAVEMPLQGQGIQCLIGRDILSRGMLIYDGTRGRFKLEIKTK